MLEERALGRALLARQGLLERLQMPLPAAVETVGALQAQHWPALPAALWSRVAGFAAGDLYAALDRRNLVTGTLLRATLHLVSAREHPAYAALVAASGVDDWRRTAAPVSAEVDRLRAALLADAEHDARTGPQISAFIESWVATHPRAFPEEELQRQRDLKWRPFLRWSALVRAPADGRWGAKAPSALRAAPGALARLAATAGAASSDTAPVSSDTAPVPTVPTDHAAQPTEAEALAAVVRRHLRAFGPAAAEDIACWTGLRVPLVRATLTRLQPDLLTFADGAGRTLYDLPDAPRPDPDTPAPPRLLAAFNSVLLAYAAPRRARILPPAHKDSVYERANLRIRPTFLVDGLVAGTWSLEVRRRSATLTLSPLVRLTRAARGPLIAEAEGLARALQPAAVSHAVVVETA